MKKQDRKINFSAGPSTLPLEILEEARENFINFHGSGASIMEISHRSQIFEEIHFGAMKKAKELYGLGDEYELLFLPGGASLNFAMVPMNFSQGGVCEYVNTGVWSQKAIAEAELICSQNKGQLRVVASSEDDNFNQLPEVKFSEGIDYAYLCSNNTIYGTQFCDYPPSTAPLIIDASSDLFSRPVDFKNIGFFFGGTQKNAGISGLACAFIRRDLLERSRAKKLPSMLSYFTHADHKSLFNTPSTFAIYIFDLEMKWLLAQGGLKKIQEKNQKKAAALYEIIDKSGGFYKPHVATKKDRSVMNVSFKINEELDRLFLSEAEAVGMMGLRGHRILGGLRASIYNALSAEQLGVLCEFMREFLRKRG